MWVSACVWVRKRQQHDTLSSRHRSPWHCAIPLPAIYAALNLFTAAATSAVSPSVSPLWLHRSELEKHSVSREGFSAFATSRGTPHCNINHTRPEYISKHSVSGQGKDQLPQHLTGLNSIQAIYWKVSVIHGMSPSLRCSQERHTIVHWRAHWNISLATQKTLDQQQLVE